MRHRLFHAIVIVGAASGCGSSNPPEPVGEIDTGVAATESGVDTSVAADSVAADSAATETAADSAAAETAADAPVDTCVDEGCGCFPCIK